jgi:hypothetical protein
MSAEKEFYELSDDTLQCINSLIERMALPFNIKVKCLGTSKQKAVCKLQRASKIVQHMNAIDLFIYINEDYYMKMEELAAEILIYQELDRLQFNISKGTFKIAKYPLQTTIGVLKKYGIDAVAEANQLTELITQQEKDGKETTEQVKLDPAKKIRKDVEFLM